MESIKQTPYQVNPLFLGKNSHIFSPKVKNNFINQNINSKQFPAGFFGPLPEKKNDNNEKEFDKTQNKQKSIYVNLQKEYDEDRELLDLLKDTKTTKNQNNENPIINEIIEEEDEYCKLKNNINNINKYNKIIFKKHFSDKMFPIQKNDENKFFSVINSKINSKKFNINDKTKSSENTIKKYSFSSSLREKLLKDKNILKNGNVSLPELNQNIFNKNSVKNKDLVKSHEINYLINKPNKFLEIKNSLSSDKIMIANNIKNKKFDTRSENYFNSKNLNNNLIDSPSTSAYTNSTKKFGFNKNLTEDYSKFHIGLFSAGFNSINNIIIPIIPLKRPESNFNFGIDQLWNNINNIKKTKNKINSNKNINNIDEDISRNNETNKIENKNFNVKLKRNWTSNKNKNKNFYKNQDYNDKFLEFIKANTGTFNDLKKIIPKLHKIKIAKGMMNTKFVDNLSKDLLGDFNNNQKQNINNNIYK